VTPAQLGRLKAFHTDRGHPGTPEGCAECAAQARRQREDAKALRAARGHNAVRATDPRSRP
jgi:hypothetical protein